MRDWPVNREPVLRSGQDRTIRAMPMRTRTVRALARHRMLLLLRRAVASLTGVLAAAILLTVPAGAETIPLDRIAHIQGLAVNPENPSRLFLATQNGMFRAAPDGTASRIGRAIDNFMSFAPDPKNFDVFYASGRLAGGGNLGVVASHDRGTTWKRVSSGADGPVDFHAMAVSRADPNVIYAMYNSLQVSRDAGRTWQKVGPLPKRTFALAASARDAATVYAAAAGGLFVSRDGGGSWRPAYPQLRPATVVKVLPGGRIYAYLYGIGLVVGDEPGVNWKVRTDVFGDRYLVGLAIDPGNPEHIHVLADTGAIVTSKDGGRTWVSYMGHDRETPQLIAKGHKIYERYCQACHGENGVGERPKNMYAEDQYGFVAPPLDNSAHGWHHTDANLLQTILNGSSRNPRMLPFKDIISREDAKDTVAYIKSLWNFRSLACQGIRHMRCMH